MVSQKSESKKATEQSMIELEISRKNIINPAHGCALGERQVATNSMHSN